MDHQEAMAYLLKDGNLSVPCSRYGRNTIDCAEVAFQASLIVADQNGDEITEDQLDYMMGLVVNDSHEPGSLIVEYRSFLELESLEPAYNKISHSEAEAMVDDMLDECYPDVTIAGITFSPSRIMKSDDDAYHQTMLDYVDSLGLDVE